jgi:hypothetical protein
MFAAERLEAFCEAVEIVWFGRRDDIEVSRGTHDPMSRHCETADDYVRDVRCVEGSHDAIGLEDPVGAHRMRGARTKRNAARLASIISRMRLAGVRWRWTAIRAGSFQVACFASGDCGSTGPSPMTR